MNRKIISILVVSFLAANMAAITGCKKKEAAAPEINNQPAQSSSQQSGSNATSKIQFGTDEVIPSLKSGWSGNESDANEGTKFTWAIGKSASLTVKLPKKQVKLTANVKVPAFAKGASQEVTVKVDGKEVGKVTMPQSGEWTKYSVTIDADNNRSAVSTIEFLFSQQATSKTDPRPLAVLFESLTLE